VRQLTALLVSALLLAGSATAGEREPSRLLPPAGASLTKEEAIELLKALRENWKPPIGEYPGTITVRVRLNPDGMLAAPPQVVSPAQGPNFSAAADSVIKSIQLGQPYRMLKPSSYASWKYMQIVFDPRDPMMHPNQQELNIMQP
jgi:hypothetical protein